MTSGRIKRSFSKSAVIAAGEYARCRQLVFMPRIKFPFFFFPPVAGSIISGARGALFSSDAILAFLIALRSLPSLSLYLSLSVSLSLSAHRRAAFSRSFVSFIYIYKEIFYPVASTSNVLRSTMFDCKPSFGYSAISKLYFRESFWTDDHRRTCKKRVRGKRSFNVVDRGCKNGAADALEMPEFGSVSGLVEIRAGRRCG